MFMPNMKKKQTCNSSILTQLICHCTKEQLEQLVRNCLGIG